MVHKKGALSRFRSGFALLITFLLFSLFYMLSVVFLLNAFVQRILVRNYVNMVKARFIAEAGLKNAIADITADFGFLAHAQNRPVDYRWRYRDPDKPVEYATYPSYAVLKDGTPKEVRIVIGQQEYRCGYSGYIQSASYGINSDIWHLRVKEASCCLYVNEGLGHPYNTSVIKRILNNLGEQLGLTERVGDLIIDNRPPDGYKSWPQLKAILGKDLFEMLKEFLCLHTYVDTRVANPVPLSYHPSVRDDYDPELYDTRPLISGTTTPLTRYGRGRTNFTENEPTEIGKIDYGWGSSAHPLNTTPMVFYGDHTELGEALLYTWQELNPCYIEVTSRAPVNINTAPRQVLVALLKDLQGFFVLEQLRAMLLTRSSGPFITAPYTTRNLYYLCRLNHPVDTDPITPPHPAYGSDPASYDISLYSVPGEIGLIFKTPTVGKDLAEQITDRIISARPFYTWQDFNDFIDRMVWLPDREDPLFDVTLDMEQISIVPYKDIFFHVFSWSLYRWYASQALADCIKANFNPNLHLNELNPNAPLYTMVDKTDLIRNSTEFCFLPTGYFEIESVGRVLRPAQEDGTFTISVTKVIMRNSLEPDVVNQVLGQRRLKVEVKLWDLYRQGVQGDFARGQYSRNNSRYHTNLNKACQSAPEVNNGRAPFDNLYEGYICLSTYGGSMGFDKEWVKGRLYRTTELRHEETWSEEAWDTIDMGMHAHFDFDFLLHKANSSDTNAWKPLNVGPAGSLPDGVESVNVWGVPDKGQRYDIGTLNMRPPFASTSHTLRLCRDYTYSNTLPSVTILSPHAQRVDGFYAEGMGILPYYSRDGNFNPTQGIISYWIKPGFFPELCGYPRVFCSISQGVVEDAPKGTGFNTFIHLWGWGAKQINVGTFFDPDWVLEPLTESSIVYFSWPFSPRPYAMTFRVDKGAKLDLPGFESWETVCASPACWHSPTLNHRFHGYPDPDKWPGGHRDEIGGNIFQAHRWVHVSLCWDNQGDTTLATRMRLNGKDWGYLYLQFQESEDVIGVLKPPDYDIAYIEKELKFNPFILGGSRWSMFSADSTIDEFLLAREANVQQQSYKKLCLRCYGTGSLRCIVFYLPKNCKPKPENPCHSDCPNECPHDETCRCLILKCSVCPYSADWFIIEGELLHNPNCSTCRGEQPFSCPDCGGDGIQEVTSNSVDIVDELRGQWEGGRYYRQNDATFVSQPIYLKEVSRPKVENCLPGPNELRDPYGQERWGDTAQKGRIDLPQITRMYPSIRILGISWTIYTEQVMDHYYSPPAKLNSQIELSLERVRRGHIAGPFLNADSGWAPIMYEISSMDQAMGTGMLLQLVGDAFGATPGSPNWNPILDLNNDGKIDIEDLSIASIGLGSHMIRYQVRFNTRCDPLNAILLETPVLDDVTIYFTTGPRFLSWMESG
jgi:hypothetical protein